MSIKNFKNPWADEWKRGGNLHPDWLGGEKALGANEDISSNQDVKSGAFFTMDGKFDRWGEVKGAEASVTIINKAGEATGVTLKNNASDFVGKDITVKQFLKRAQRVWAEGGRRMDTAQAYAHAQDNKRKTNGNREIDNYKHMSTTDFDVDSIHPSYKDWNKIRGIGYNDIGRLNNLIGSDAAIVAITNLLLGKSTDPTNGANQWRGNTAAENAKKDYESQTKLKKGDYGTGTDGAYIVNLTYMTTPDGKHAFFNFTFTPPQNKN